VRAAAALLRHHLEHFAKEACDRLRAKVEYRGDAQFALDDLHPTAMSALGEALNKAKAAATSWGQKDVMDQIARIDAAFTDAKIKTGFERWQINAAVHFDEWATLKREDVVSVVRAFREFTECFSCDMCKEMHFVSPERGPKEALRCTCASVNLNLLAKSAQTGRRGALRSRTRRPLATLCLNSGGGAPGRGCVKTLVRCILEAKGRSGHVWVHRGRREGSGLAVS
jgi:hypothetical protein